MDKMDLIWGIEQMEKELAKAHSPASNIMNICTEVLKQASDKLNTINEKFTKEEFEEVKAIKVKTGRNWHDFIMFAAHSMNAGGD